MAATVLGGHLYRDGLEDLVEAGASPLYEPESWGGSRIRLPEGRMSLIQRGNSWVLYALTSAAKDFDHGANPFTKELGRVLRDVKPNVLVTGPVSRIVRHEHHVSDAVRALSSARVLLDTAGAEVIDFAHSPTAGGDFVALATQAIRERSVIVSRMDAGRLAGASRGCYPFAAATLPLGYVRTPDRRIALADQAVIDAVSGAFEQLADPTQTVYEVAARLVSKQIIMGRKAGPSGERTMIGMENAKAIVNRLIRQVDAYDLAQHHMNHRTHIPGEVADDGGVPVVSYIFELPLPDGGWAASDVMAAVRQRGMEAQARRHRLRQTTSEKHEEQLPLTGYRWRDGNLEYAVLSRYTESRGSHYMLAAREPAASAVRSEPGGLAWTRSLGRGWGQATIASEQFQCLISPEELHRSIADAVGGLDVFLFEGSAAILNSAEPAVDDTSLEDQVVALRAELARSQRTKRLAHEAFYSTTRGDAMHAVFQTDYREASEAVVRLTQHLERLEGESTKAHESSGREPLKVSAGDFLLALARLRLADGRLPRRVVAALHAVVAGFTLAYDKKRGTAHWKLRLRLPAQESAGKAERQTAPISGTVPISPIYLKQESPAARERNAVRLAGRQAELRPDTVRDAIRGLHTLGVCGRGAAQSLLGAPLEVRLVVIGHLLGDALTDAVDPAFADLAVKAYTDASGAGQYQWNAPRALRQEILDVLAHEGPTERGVLQGRFEHRLEGRDLDSLLRSGDGHWLSIALINRHYVAASRDGGQRVTASCRSCPHCSGRVDIVARVRECPTGLLCSACLRMPVQGSPEFPECYRDLAARPQARRAITTGEPAWWAELRRAVRCNPEITLTLLSARLGRKRHEVKGAADAMKLRVRSIAGIPPEWTDERLREVYIDRDTRLTDLAYELGVSTGTLSKRLKRAGITKHSG